MKNEKEAPEGLKVGKKAEKTENYITVFRQNIDREMAQNDWTIRETAEKSDMNFETLKNFLYDKEAKDCRLSTAIKLARAFGVSIDELVGSATAKPDDAQCLKMYRKLPESSKSLIRWHIQDQTRMHTEHHLRRRIKIMIPICASNGNLRKTTFYEEYELNNSHNEILHKVFFGIRIPCDHHLPHYMKDDILLIANDRSPLKDEVVVLVVDNLFWKINSLVFSSISKSN